MICPRGGMTGSPHCLTGRRHLMIERLRYVDFASIRRAWQAQGAERRERAAARAEGTH